MFEQSKANKDKLIYSLFDYSGNWVKPYRDAGYRVVQVDIKHGQDIRTLEIPDEKVYGILSAPPCTHFAGSGARWWAEKDADGRTEQGLELIGATTRFILACDPVFWVLENPVGRLNRWLGKPTMYFQPYEYGDPISKKTALWGKFNTNLKKNPVEPKMYTTSTGKSGSWYWMKLGGASEKTKELRSMTPMGFAQAFYEVNR
jgi:hypothetical protein